MNILDAIAAALSTEDLDQSNNGTTPRGGTSTGDTQKPILQFNNFPVTIDPDLYKNARSTSNPGGDLRSLYAFRELTDPIPNFTRTYSPSAASLETVYKNIVNNINVLPSATYAASVVDEAQQNFSENTFADMDGTPGVWRPVYATPEDWYAAADSRFRSLSLDISGNDSNSGFQQIGIEQSLDLFVGQESSTPLSDSSEITGINMKYMLVTLRRPWFDETIFKADNWYLQGESSGFCSSGNINSNNGVLPIVTTGILLAKDVSVQATWDQDDEQTINQSLSDGKVVSVGPFLLDSSGTSSSLQIIGWVSNLVPLSPPQAMPESGSVLVKNKGAFIARFSVSWSLGTATDSNSSGNFPVLSNKEIDIPALASDISIKIEIMTFPKPVETWSVVQEITLDAPATKSYELSGTTFSPKLAEVSS